MCSCARARPILTSLINVISEFIAIPQAILFTYNIATHSHGRRQRGAYAPSPPGFSYMVFFDLFLLFFGLFSLPPFPWFLGFFLLFFGLLFHCSPPLSPLEKRPCPQIHCFYTICSLRYLKIMWNLQPSIVMSPCTWK